MSLAAQQSHCKIAVTTVAASVLAPIPLQKSQCFSLRRPQKKIASRSRFLGLASESQEAHGDHGRKSAQLHDFADGEGEGGTKCMSARHPSVATYPLANHSDCRLHVKSAERAATSGWRALTDVPTSLVIQLRNPPVSKPPVRHDLKMLAQPPVCYLCKPPWGSHWQFGCDLDCVPLLCAATLFLHKQK